MIQKFPGRRAAPAFIRRREMLPDIAGADGAQDRIGQRMQSGIGIGMAFERMIVRDLHAAEPDMIARRETMRVIAIAGSRLAEPRGQKLFRHARNPLAW